jgi:transcription elongation GreA/GreB family factor
VKADLVAQIKKRLEAELAAAEGAATSAHSAATDSEAKPENKYDTRGLEASYLAGAQRARITELQDALARLVKMVILDFKDGDAVKTSALIDLAPDGSESNDLSCVFLTEAGAGYTLRVGNERVTTVTPQSPIGRALLGSRVGDAVTVRIGGKERVYEVARLR